MYPVLFTLGPVTVYTFGVFVFFAFFASCFVVWLYGRREDFDEEKLLDAALVVSLFGLAGARIFYGLFAFDFGLADLLRVFSRPGFVWQGGLLGGFYGLSVFARRQKWSFPRVADIFVLGAALGEGIGRVGCFFNGCAYGSPTTLPWGVSMAGLLGKRHPTQLYEAIFSLFVFSLLLKLRKKRRFTGFISLVYLCLSQTGRIFFEFFRGDSVYWGRIKSAQAISLVIVLVSSVLLYRRLKRSPRSDLETLAGFVFYLGGQACWRLSCRARELKAKIRQEKGKNDHHAETV